MNNFYLNTVMFIYTSITANRLFLIINLNY